MVSQPEPSHSHSYSLAIRGPSSVTSSRHSSSRHRRHGRSHAGGSSYIPQNEFPVFTHTGDVEIIIKAGSQTNRYLLHRLILTQCSGFFEASTSEQWSRAESVPVAGGGELARIGEDSGSGSESARNKELSSPMKKRWRYELDTGTDDDIPMLVQKSDTAVSLFGTGDSRPPPIRSKPPASSASFFRSVANLTLPSAYSSSPSTSISAPPLTQAEADLLTDYDNLLRIFYNHPPTLNSIDIATAYIQCKSLLQLADLYDALPVVGSRIDHHLLQFQSRLWKQIAKYPSSYLKLGYLAQSKTIFQEALIHVVGAWPSGERNLRGHVPDHVLELVEDKVEDLADLVSSVERRLFRSSLVTSRGERATPQNGYLDWLATSLFRQWLVDNTSPPLPPPIPPPASSRGSRNGTLHSHSHSQHRNLPHPPPAPHSITTASYPHSSPQTLPTSTPHLGRTYRLLGSPSPTAYLGHEECKKFLKLAGAEWYSRENLKRFERRLDELKAVARGEVGGLLGCDLLLGDGGGGVAYLTCTTVGEGDFPWGGEGG